ncbi:hypothetical protein V6Z12_D08G298400 [Gossypium hirsutum]
MADSKRYISKTEFETHKKPDDLWISIQGKIYNVTQWSHHHPGGPLPLLNLAGQDATDAFIAYHPGIAWQYLDKFFTGYYLEGYLVSDISEDYRKLAVEFSKMGLFDKKGHGTWNCLAGISMGWWKWTHNAHHIACNSLDFDPDLQHMPFFTVSSKFFNSITSAFYGSTYLLNLSSCCCLKEKSLTKVKKFLGYLFFGHGIHYSSLSYLIGTKE